jgi:ATP-dependent helicase HrpB
LNTDIVLGIAKLLRRLRPDDFYVVIASATIDPGPFLAFFHSPHQSLDVPGRVFPVTLAYKMAPEGMCLSSKKLITEHVVPSVIEALDAFTEGHVLVFLPGQTEIDQAIKAFNYSSEGCTQDIVVFPLFGSLPPEEQDKIMQFDGQCDEGQRMVVFTTNVAETSLTIPGVKLVIDVGLAKEVRYDQARRLSVIELVRISRSSAEQRKGRAGRISSGMIVIQICAFPIPTTVLFCCFDSMNYSI